MSQESIDLHTEISRLTSEREKFLKDLEKLKRSSESSEKILRLSSDLVELRSQLQTAISERDSVLEESRGYEAKWKEASSNLGRLRSEFEVKSNELIQTNDKCLMLEDLVKDLQGQVSSYSKEKNEAIMLLERHCVSQRLSSMVL